VCGALAQALGARLACALLAAICAIIVLALYSGSARLRGLRLSHYR
jgi:hypothetical protein